MYANPPSVGVYGDVVRVKILFNKKDTALIQFNDGQQAQTGTYYYHRACSFRVVQNLSDKWFRYSFGSGCTMQFYEIIVLWYFDGVCTFCTFCIFSMVFVHDARNEQRRSLKTVSFYTCIILLNNCPMLFPGLSFFYLIFINFSSKQRWEKSAT